MNELILADQELEVGFIEKLDAMLEGIERMGTGSGMAQGEPPHLAGLPQQRDDCLLSVGRQNPVQGIRHRKDGDEWVSERLPLGYVI